MRATGEQVFHDLLRTDVKPRHNNLEFYKRLFLCECRKMLLHKQSRVEGLLSSCANLVYPQTEINAGRIEIKEVSKEEIASKLQVHTNKVQLKEEKDIKKTYVR